MPSLRRLPLLKLIALGEVALLARDHVQRLRPHERRRLVQLVRSTRGRPWSLTPKERDELAGLVAKAEPRAFVLAAAEKLSPVPLPARLAGRRRNRG